MFFKKRPIKLYWWRYEDSAHGNFGDEITRVIIERVFKKHVSWAPVDQSEIIGAGSLMQDVCQLVGDNRPYIWGTGFIERGNMRIDTGRFKLLGVRGVLTKSRIDHDMPNIFLGDTGLLASRAIKGSKKKHRVGIVPHYVDRESPAIQQLRDRFGEDLLVIDATEQCENVIAAISSCEYIVSSSLHGLIVADSYYIPNQHLALSDGVRGGDYKFKDYYSAFSNREYQHLTIENLDRFLTVDELTNYIETKYTRPADLPSIQQKMIESFPY